MPHPNNHTLYTEAGTVGLDPNTSPFDPDFPYSYCRICGYLFQSPLQREPVLNVVNPNEPNDSFQKKVERRDAMLYHEKIHEADGSLAKYQASPYYMTPEAAHRLVPYGIIPLSDMVAHEDVEHAANTAPRTPYTEDTLQ